MFMTPGGRSVSSNISKIIVWLRGVCSEGLSTWVLPAAIAYGQNQNGTMAGKLKGATQPNTPKGCRHALSHDGIQPGGWRLGRRRWRDDPAALGRVRLCCALQFPGHGSILVLAG